MAKHTTLASLFKAIADAIREKTGSTDTIVADNFPTEIAAIESVSENISAVLVPGAVIAQGFDENDTTISSNTTAMDIDETTLAVILPDSATRIYQMVFRDCSNLKWIILSECLSTIDSYAFYCCTSLTTIKFPPTLTNIADTAFYGCANLTDIYVPWAEGAVANAPWGADNATIHYNYTG